MSITVLEGYNSAILEVNTLLPRYSVANHCLGHHIEMYKEACPIGYAIGHVLSVNPQLQISPLPTKDSRRGFMYATATMARYAGVNWKKLDDLNTCAYVWGYDINKTAESVYNKYGYMFNEPNSDFWNTTYLKHYLGDTVFDLLWNYRDTSKDGVYFSLLYGTTSIKNRIGIFTVSQLRKAVLFKSRFVVEMAKKAGSTVSDIWFRTPVLSKNQMLRIYESD